MSTKREKDRAREATPTDMSAGGGFHERGVSVFVLMLHLSPGLQQESHYLLVASTAGIRQRCVTCTACTGQAERERERESIPQNALSM